MPNCSTLALNALGAGDILIFSGSACHWVITSGIIEFPSRFCLVSMVMCDTRCFMMANQRLYGSTSFLSFPARQSTGVRISRTQANT